MTPLIDEEDFFPSPTARTINPVSSPGMTALVQRVCARAHVDLKGKSVGFSLSGRKKGQMLNTADEFTCVGNHHFRVLFLQRHKARHGATTSALAYSNAQVQGHL